MKQFLILLASVAAPLLLYSQTIVTGKIANTTGVAIPNASVFLLQANKKTINRAVLSDSTGSYSMPVADSVLTATCFIYASYLNYRSDTIQVTAQKNSYDIQLAVKETLLQEVVVESNAPVVKRMADRFIFVPNKALTEGATALDILKYAPLVQFDERNGLFSIINKEGTVVYINNRKSNLPKEMIISTLRSAAASDIKNIEVITSPGSEYSANTSGGVININLKKLFDEGWSGNVFVASEQAKFNTSMLNGTVNYRKGKVGIRVSPFLNSSFNYNTRENQIDQVAAQRRAVYSETYRRYKVLGGGLGFDYDIDKFNLLSFNGFYSTVHGKSRNDNETIVADSLLSSPTKGKDRYTYNFGNVYFQHYFDSRSKHTLTVNVDYNQFYQGNKIDGWFIKNTSKEIGRYRNDLPQQFFNISQRVDYTSQINSKTKLTVGAQFSNTNVSNDLKYFDWNYGSGSFVANQVLTTNYKYHESYLAGYLSYTKSFSDKLNGVFGLRAEQINYSSENVKQAFKADTNYISLFPSLSLAYALNKKNNISLALSRKIRRPDIEQLFPGRTYYNPEYLQENNPFLQPVFSYNSEFMYAWQNKYYFSAGYTTYRNQYTQFIIPLQEDGIDKLKRTYLNYGNTSSTWFSFFSQQDIIKKLWYTTLSMNVNYASYRIKQQEALFNTTDLTNINYNLTWNNTLYISNKKKWIGFATFRYNSPFKNISYERTNGLFFTELGVRKTIKNLSASLYLSDLFNSNGRTRILYNPNLAYSYNYLYQNNYTRRISVSLRYAFGNNKLKLNKNKSSANEEIKGRIGN